MKRDLRREIQCEMKCELTEVNMEAYAPSILGILALCLVSVFSAVYSGYSKGRAGILSGPVLPADEANLLYRIDRIHMNSVEALAPFIVPAVLAIEVGVGSATLAVLVWVHVALRLTHLAVYLRGGKAARGGSVRTILYVSSAMVTFILILVTGWAAIHQVSSQA